MVPNTRAYGWCGNSVLLGAWRGSLPNTSVRFLEMCDVFLQALCNQRPGLIGGVAFVFLAGIVWMRFWSIGSPASP
jgi:hypothetical protein